MVHQLRPPQTLAEKVDLVKGTLALSGTNSSALTTPTIEFNGAADGEAVLEFTKGDCWRQLILQFNLQTKIW